MGLVLKRAATALLLPRPCVLKPGFVQAAQEPWAVLAAGRGGLVGKRGEQTLPLGGWRWHSHGLAGRAGDQQPKPSPKEPFGVNSLKVEEAPPYTPSLVIPCLKHAGGA